MKRKLLSALLAVAMAAFGLAGTAAFAAVQDTADYNPLLAATAEMGSNGAESTYQGVTYRVSDANKDFYRGTDADGNLFFQQVRTEDYYWAISDKQVYIDGFNASFKIEQLYADYPVQTGANWTVGLRYENSTGIYPHEMVGVTLVYDAEEDAFHFYMNTREWTFWPKAHYNANSFADGTPIDDETIELGGHAAGEGFIRPGLGDEITLQFRKLTVEEARAYGAENFGNKSEIYYWFINGYLIDLPCVNIFPNDPGTTAYVPTWIWNGSAVYYGGNAADGYYGYFQLLDNQFNKAAVDIGSNFVETATSSTGRSARVTFFDISGSGMQSGAPVRAEGSAYRTSVAAVGALKGATVYSAASAGTGYAAVAANATDLSAAEVVSGVEFVGARSEGAVAQVYYAASADGTGSTFGFDIRRAGIAGVYIDFNVNGTAYPTSFSSVPLSYNFGEQLPFSVFSGDTDIFIAGGEMLELSAEAQAAFAAVKEDFEGGGYLVLGSSDGSASVAKVSTVDDGTATRKGMLLSMNTALTGLTVARGTAVETLEAAFPSEIEFAAETGGGEAVTVDAAVTWSHSVDTTVPGNYTVRGTLADLSSIEQNYYVSAALLNAISFNVQVQYDEEYVLFSGTDYAALNSRWGNAGGGANNFYYYQDEEGWDHFISDLYSDARGQYMPGYSSKVDVDNFTWEIRLNALAANAQYAMFFNATSGPSSHPVQAETSGRHFGIWFNRLSENPSQAYINVQQGYYLGGALQEGSIDNARGWLYSAEDGTWTQYFDVGWDGSTAVSLRTELENGELNVYVILGDKEYLITANNETTTIFDWESISDAFAGNKMYPMIWCESGLVEAVQRFSYTKYIVSYTRPADKVVDFNADHGLPSEIAATLNTGEQITASVEWTGEYDKTAAGDYVLTGTLSAEGIGSDANGVTEDCSASFDVRVTVRNETLLIKTFEKQPDLEIEIGETPTFQTTFTVTVYSAALDESRQAEITVTWNSEDFNRLVAGTYTFTAQPSGNYAFDESLADNTRVTVTVKAAGGSSDPGTTPGGETGGDAGGCSGSLSAGAGIAFAVLLAAGSALSLKKRRH